MKIERMCISCDYHESITYFGSISILLHCVTIISDQVLASRKHYSMLCVYVYMYECMYVSDGWKNKWMDVHIDLLGIPLPLHSTHTALPMLQLQ